MQKHKTTTKNKKNKQKQNIKKTADKQKPTHRSKQLHKTKQPPINVRTQENTLKQKTETTEVRKHKHKKHYQLMSQRSKKATNK